MSAALKNGRLTRTAVQPTPFFKAASLLKFQARYHVVVGAGGRDKALTAHTTWLRTGGADAEGSPFAVLRLSEGGLANVGGAVHRRRYSGITRQDTPNKDWSTVFKDPTRPLLVDVGCGAGRFVLLSAYYEVIPGIGSHDQGRGKQPCVYSGQPGNFLGLDQHEQLMERGNLWATARGLSSHCHYLAINARGLGLSSLLSSYPGPIALLSVLYPDPHYRQTRHVVDAVFVEECSTLLGPGAGVLLASDVQGTARFMRDCFATYGRGAFKLHALHMLPGETFADDGGSLDPYLPSSSSSSSSSGAAGLIPGLGMRGNGLQLSDEWAHSGWLMRNPLGELPTEREVFASQVTHGSVFRVLLSRE